MTKAQKVTPFAMLVVIFLAVGWSLLPFQFIEGVDCDAPLLGGQPRTDELVGLVLPDEDCPAKARSRLLTSAIIALVAAGAATAAVALQPISPQCSRGDHDACRFGWGNLLGEDSGIGCQCDCHQGEF
ncbi:MAG TPA: hypothetical protein VM390_12890 [Acidimicrobiales bacterium]|nr:hypothetical protein [Acidimicrobiales bacterium]